MSDIRKYIELLENAEHIEQSVFIGDDHSAEFWEYNYNAFREFKPDYLLLEVIGKHRYLTKDERDDAKNTYVYMDDERQQGYNSDAFKLANDLDIPMIGIDIWDEPYIFDDGLDFNSTISNSDLDKSHRIREEQMTKVAKEFLAKGKVLLIVGAEHLREDSELALLADDHVDIKFFKM